MKSGAIFAIVLLVATACNGSGRLLSGEDLPDATPTPLEPEATPSPEPTATPQPTPTPSAADCLASAPDEFLVGQSLMVLVDPAQFPAMLEAAQTTNVGFVALLGSPSADQLSAFTAELDTAGDGNIWVASDEEGGRVQRLAEAIYPLPGAADLALSSPGEATQTFADYATEAKALGVDMFLGPVVDVGAGPGISDRSFSDDPAVVTEYATAVIKGTSDGGVAPVIKHFPGHGRADQDSHLGLAVGPPLEELEAIDLLPYQDLADSGAAIMVGHLDIEGLTEPGIPTSLSSAAINGLLRKSMGFDGLVITDALNMGAIAQRWSQPEAAVLALSAGADVAIIDSPIALADTSAAIVVALSDGSLSRDQLVQSTTRVLETKGISACELFGG